MVFRIYLIIAVHALSTKPIGAGFTVCSTGDTGLILCQVESSLASKTGHIGGTGFTIGVTQDARTVDLGKGV